MIPITNQSLKGYRFIDLFSGIGGFHYALSSYGAKCVFASEWDAPAAQVYKENFGLMPHGDITKISAEEIPAHDILCAGFPCQAFSISGKQKGFDDTRGTLFFDIARITDAHNPKILFLENVKNLHRHNGGNTINKIVSVLEGLGYNVKKQILNSSDFGLPQNRERVYILGFRKDIDSSNFKFPTKLDVETKLIDIVEAQPEARIIVRNDIRFNENWQEKKINNRSIINRPIQIGIVNKGGQGERIYHPNGHSITLSAYGGGAGAKTGLYLIENVVRKLSPRECARLQGFPDSHILPTNPNVAYKQFGNSVSINVLQHILREISCVLVPTKKRRKEYNSTTKKVISD